MKEMFIRYTAVLLGLPLIIFAGFFTQTYYATPEHIRYPKFEHYHIRTQIIVAGKALDFSTDRYQQEYDKGACSVDIASEPIHFHDHLDQLTHIHWDGITGGEFMKYYGWNYIGGSSDNLGKRYDNNKLGETVDIYNYVLPKVPEGINFYIYTGDELGYEKRNWQEFLDSDIEVFFGKQSNLGGQTASRFNLMNWLFPKASAHDDRGHNKQIDLTQDDLKRINNLIGNVVIFVQEDEPSSDEVAARFASLVPLSDSTCGG